MILNDYLQPGLSVVFCGTAAGDRSAERGHLYAGPGSKFWRMLHQTGLTPAVLSPEDDRRICAFRIGLTDLVKHHSGADSTLQPDMYDVEGFRRKILDHDPCVVAFNGKKAASVFLGCKTSALAFGLHPAKIGQTQTSILPSTSGAASGSWSAQPWHDLAALIKQLHPK